jgi:hypothetical protein
MLSSSLQILPSDGREPTGRMADSTAIGPMRSSPYQVTIIIRWLSEVPTNPTDESLARHEAGQFLSQTGFGWHLPIILAVNSKA